MGGTILLKKDLDPGTGSRPENKRMGATATVGSMGASECARQAGVSTDTLRYYERQRLLPAPPRTPNGYRRYPAEALKRIRVIRCALAMGFSVGELARIQRTRDRGIAPCGQVRQLAAEKLQTLDLHIRELQRLRKELRKTLAAWDVRLAGTPSGGRAALLESLANTRPPIARQLSPLLAPGLSRKLTQCAPKRAMPSRPSKEMYEQKQNVFK
jgi:MerR family transcriptional regulator, copper efflux regulator